MGAIIKIIVAYSTAFWRTAGLSGQVATDDDTLGIVMDDARDSGPAVLLCFVLAWAASAAAQDDVKNDLDDAKRALTRRIEEDGAITDAHVFEANGFRIESSRNKELGANLRTAARTPASSPLARIDASLVPAPLSLQGPNDDCALITLSAPAFAGDAAFVEYAYACGTVCGNGGLYALQRRENRWELVGIADVWIR